MFRRLSSLRAGGWGGRRRRRAKEKGGRSVYVHTPLINEICSEEKDLLLQCEVVFFHFTFEDGRDCACSISWKPFFWNFCYISVLSL